MNLSAQLYQRSISTIRSEIQLPSTWKYFKNRTKFVLEKQESLPTIPRSGSGGSAIRHLQQNKTDCQNYYKLLGLNENAMLNDIKRAYYNLAKLYHPDTNKIDNTESILRFQKISEAYEILSDENKRNEYDRTGVVSLKTSQLHSAVPSEPVDEKHSKDLNLHESNINIPITFLQSVHGVKREISVPSRMPCSACRNQTTTMDTQLILCQNCKGSGKELHSLNSEICKMCKGAKHKLKNQCVKCGGRKTVLSSCRITVDIPTGVIDGDIITVVHPVTKQELNVILKITSQDQFKRQDFDIYSDVEIPFKVAILGGTISIRTVHDITMLTIPPGTHSHTEFRVYGKGIQKSTKNTFGDHVVKIKVKTPSNLTNNQKNLLLPFLDNIGQEQLNESREKKNKIINKPNRNSSLYDYLKELKFVLN